MSLGSHLFLKKTSKFARRKSKKNIFENSPGENAFSPGEFENFRSDIENETMRCNMAIKSLIRISLVRGGQAKIETRSQKHS